MREKMMYLTMDEVARLGPGAFNSATVCDRLGVTYPMVNHYFGGRDGLLAETAFEVYRRYIGYLWEAVDSAPREPKKRLAAWMSEQVKRTCDMGGWGAVLNYPFAAMNVTSILNAEYGEEIQKLFEVNLARLGMLVADVRSGQVTDLPAELSPDLRAELMANSELISVGASVAWSTLGAAVWNSGQHLPSAKVVEIWVRSDELVDAHIQHVVNSL